MKKDIPSPVGWAGAVRATAKQSRSPLINRGKSGRLLMRRLLFIYVVAARDTRAQEEMSTMPPVCAKRAPGPMGPRRAAIRNAGTPSGSRVCYGPSGAKNVRTGRRCVVAHSRRQGQQTYDWADVEVNPHSNDGKQTNIARLRRIETFPPRSYSTYSHSGCCKTRYHFHLLPFIGGMSKG